MSRKQARDVAVKLGYAKMLGGDGACFNIETLEEIALREPDKQYLQVLDSGVEERGPELDELIESYSTSWRLNRIGRVELSILRVALYEILYVADVPTSVAINEAVELAKRYCEEKSPAFVNGVLGGIARNVQRETE